MHVVDSRLFPILEHLAMESGAPASAAVVVSQSEVIAQGIFGLRHAEQDAPAMIGDRFHIGSNTKAWTATVGANLVSENVINWDTRLSEVFGQPVLADYETITLEMLLRHKAGIPPYTEEEHYQKLPDFGGNSTDQRIAFAEWLLLNHKPVDEPGSEMSYSNAGYGIAAAMMEKASGRSWEGMIVEEIGKPLAIMVGFGWPNSSGGDQPTGHMYKDGAIVPHGSDTEYDLPAIIAPAGDLNCSMPDYGRFLQENLRALHGGETILPVDLMLRMHNNGEPGSGMGWGVQPVGDAGLFSAHVGGAGTFICIAAISHAHDVALAIAVNAGSEGDEPVEAATKTGFKAMLDEFVTG